MTQSRFLARTNRGPVLLDFERARAALRGLARATPLLEAPALSEGLGRKVLLKLENLQVTGSFKVRGAAARLDALSPGERRRGVVACSSGNHGSAVAWVAGRLGIPATIFVPEWVDPVKLEAIRASGAQAVLVGSTFDEAEAHARAFARESARLYVSAYDDPWVIAGQGTLALEVLEALGEPPTALLAPLSGGGLIGGIAAALRWRESTPPTRAVAVSAERAAVMLASLRAGRPVELPEVDTVAGALSGGIGLENTYSFPIVRDLVDEHVVVSETSIRKAMAFAFRELRLVVEGGGATALAALLSEAWRPAPAQGGAVVVVVSGGNVSLRVLQSVLEGSDLPT